MKGYILNNKCYIFPQEAGQIPEVEASVFYVQEENYAAWLEANESLVDKLVKYNYNTMTVQPKVWAGHEDDDLEPVGPTTYTITLTEGSNTYIQNPYPNPAEAGATVKIEPQGGYATSNVDVTSSDVEISSGFDEGLGIYIWYFTMPATDVTLTAVAKQYATLTCAADYSEILADIPESIVVNDYTHIYAQSGTTIYGAYEASAKDANDNDVNCYIGDDESVTIYPTTTSTVTLTLTPVNP